MKYGWFCSAQLSGKLSQRCNFAPSNEVRHRTARNPKSPDFIQEPTYSGFVVVKKHRLPSAPIKSGKQSQNNLFASPKSVGIYVVHYGVDHL